MNLKKDFYFFLLTFSFVACLGIEMHGQVAYAKNGMVSSSSMIASEVGRDILKKGGNAIDASVATAFALAVTWPSAGNIGGGGFLVFMNDDGEVTTIDFREKAPLAASKDMFLDGDGKLIEGANHMGIRTVGVPGTVAGLYLAHQKYGKLPWKDVVQPAVDLAKNGFEFTWTLSFHATYFYENFQETYPALANFMTDKNGNQIEPGEIWKQPELAKTLERIRDKGKDGFYKGETANKLTDYFSANNGLITQKDLDKYEAIERKPVKGTYHGFEVYSMPPPSSGGVVLIEMLNMLEGYELTKMGFGSAAYFHTLAEVMRRAYADRAEYLGDPEFNPEMPVDILLSKEHATDLSGSINPDKASPSDSSRFGQLYEGDHTTHISVLDKDGNAVSLTYTLEYSYGSRLVPDGLGFILNNEMGDFNPVPGLTNSRGWIGTPPNLIASEKRMLSSMTPTIVAKDGKPFLVIGSPGGRTIINSVLQTILNVLDFDMDISKAIEAGKIHHQWLPDRIMYEDMAVSPDTKSLLEKMGHNLFRVPNIGSLMGITFDAQKELMSGAADSSSPDGGVARY